MHKLDLSQELKSSSTPVAPEPLEKVATQTPQTTSPTLDESPVKADNHSSLHPIEPNTMNNNSKKLAIIAVVLAISAGVATGFGSYRLSNQGGNSSSLGGQKIETVATSGKISIGDVFGSQDTSTYKDEAECYLEKGGIDGEGSHKLIRPGGISQTVYLTSSVTDLDVLEGMQVRVWGETFKGQQAGWLMDVGRIEVVDTESEKPEE